MASFLPVKALLLAVLLAFLPATGSAENVTALIGAPRVHLTAPEDTLADIALRYVVGYTELLAANPLTDPWLPQPGIPIILPTRHLLPEAPHDGIVINLADQRLYFFPPDGPPLTWPLGIGIEEATRFTGSTQVVRKRVNPSWYPTARMRAADPSLPRRVPPGPDNPLGTRALYLGVPTILIHGTNLPYGVGRRVSQGCFRLNPDAVEALYRQVAVGTPVTVVDQPVKLAWVSGELWLEVHPTVDQAAELEITRHITAVPDIEGVRAAVTQAAGDRADRVDWAKVERLARERNGIPEPVSIDTENS
jgi:L,D-transpeptidase ErfK/SrfK